LGLVGGILGIIVGVVGAQVMTFVAGLADHH